VASLTTITHAADLVVSWVKAAVFGPVLPALIACLQRDFRWRWTRRLSEIAVNETVRVLRFVALFRDQTSSATAIGVEGHDMTGGHSQQAIRGVLRRGGERAPLNSLTVNRHAGTVLRQNAVCPLEDAFVALPNREWCG